MCTMFFLFSIAVLCVLFLSSNYLLFIDFFKNKTIYLFFLLSLLSIYIFSFFLSINYCIQISDIILFFQITITHSYQVRIYKFLTSPTAGIKCHKNKTIFLITSKDVFLPPKAVINFSFSVYVDEKQNFVLVATTTSSS